MLRRSATGPAIPPSSGHRRHRRVALAAAIAAGALILAPLAAAPSYAAFVGSSLPPDSTFEIDTDANLKVDGGAAALDWANVSETRRADLPSGAGDNSFGQGSKEDTPVPTVVDGSIPPNKSDLKNFGVSLETTASGRYLHLFWHRVQDPSGTTNMDFEFNQSSTISANGVTPVRTAGDLLIQYDLSQGGTNPVLSVSKWVATGAGSLCEANNTTPCWGKKQNLSAANKAIGSINTSAIAAGDADGLGSISPRTFGEASLDFAALTGGTSQCVSFGSAYLKSRSSDSFTAAMKDFIAPTPLNLSNCGTVTIRKQTNPEEDPNTTTFGYTKAFNTASSTPNTFTLQDDGVKTYTDVLAGQTGTVTEDAPPSGWDLQAIDCTTTGQSTATTDLISRTVTFTLAKPGDSIDCTYTNRARGSIVIEKITDDGMGSFDFTSQKLGPFTLVTTAAGDGGKGSQTFADLTPGTYAVAETVPADWHLVGSSCSDGSTVDAIALAAGETVTCTFHDARDVGAIKIVKTRKHAADGAGDHPHAGVTFTVTGGELPAEGVTAVTDANGVACVPGLLVSSLAGGDYTVTESVPAGYHLVGANGKKATVTESEADCDPISSDATVSFQNMPLTNITVTVDSQVDGGTASTIECTPIDPGADAVTDAKGDGSFTLTDREPGTYVCTVEVDP
ncbi:MSCRAMM family protein [Agromyces soli]